MNNISNPSENLGSSDFAYYIYGYTIARVDKKTAGLEIKQHPTNQWKQTDDPRVWQRIQVDGDQISKADADEIYQIFHDSLQLKNSQKESKKNEVER